MFFNRILFCFILYFTGTFTNANAVQPISVLLPDNILSHLLNRGFRIGFNISCTDLSSTLSECNNIGVFDIIKHRSYLASDGPKYFSEASMAFRKSFWNQRPFYQEDKQGEGKYFCLYREHEMMSIPFQFVIIALKHRHNTTNSIRNISENNSSQKQSDLFKLFHVAS